MGSTMFKGVSLQYTLQLNQTTQSPKLRNTYKMFIQVYKNDHIQQIYNRYKITNQIQDIQEIERNHTLGPSMPQVAFTPLGLPSLAI
jgi:hypothetical protein